MQSLKMESSKEKEKDYNPVYREMENNLNRRLVATEGGVKVSAKQNENKDHVRVLVDTLFKQMREIDKLFCKMTENNNVRDCGSTKYKLKVLKPDEFDKDIQLDIPIKTLKNQQNGEKQGRLVITQFDDYPSWAICKLEPKSSFDWGLPRKKRRKCWKKIMDSEGRFINLGIRSWMFSLVNRSVKVLRNEQAKEKKTPTQDVQNEAQTYNDVVHKNLNKPDVNAENSENKSDDSDCEGNATSGNTHYPLDWFNLKVTCSGPAVTLLMLKEKIGIDLVATIKIPQDCKEDILNGLEVPSLVQIDRGEGSIDSNVPVTVCMEDLKGCQLVPVEPRVAIGSTPAPNYYLRLSVPKLEYKLISKKEKLKDGFRLIKALRDNNEWKPIASYFLVNMGIGAGFADDVLNDLPLLFIGLLQKLVHHLREGALPLPWAPGCNLFIKLQEPFRTNTANRVQKFLNEIERCNLMVLNNKNVKLPIVLKKVSDLMDDLFRKKIEPKVEDNLDPVSKPQASV